MSDDATTSSKRRGRKAKIETKKPTHKEVKHVDNEDEDGAAAPKRGRRGRPKGITQKKSPAKPKGKSAAGRRGRSKKEEKAKDSGDENKEENDVEDNLDD